MDENMMTNVPEPCPRCLSLAFCGDIPAEAMMPLPEAPPLAIEDIGEHSPAASPICHDCQAAENLVKRGVLEGMGFIVRRIAVANDRLEQLRMPESIRSVYGLVGAGYVRPSEGENALDDHRDWLESVGIRMGEEYDL